MVIGRSNERNTPDDANGALRHRMAVEGSFAETIWAAVMTPHRKPGHMIAPDQTPTLLQSALETRGPVVPDSEATERALMFLPALLPAGIESADPMVQFRNKTCPISYDRRHQSQPVRGDTTPYARRSK